MKNRSQKDLKWWVLAAMSSCVSMIFLDQTVLPVALPTIQRELEVSALGLQWLINSYLLALTALVIAGGRIGDIFGHRKLFAVGIGIFSGASAMCGLSFSEAWFITSRAIQGVGAAILIPSSTTILVSAFPLKERGKALGIYIGIGSVFLTLGPFIGGMFTEYLTWRYVFWINLPIAAIGLAMAFFTVPKSEARKEPFDFLGFFAFSIGIVSVVVALMERPHWGWTSPITLGLILLGACLISSLCLLDRKVEHPFFDFSIFKDKLFTGSVLCVFCAQFLLMGTIFWAIYFQNVLEMTPIAAGTLTVMTTFPVIVCAPLGGILLDRFGPRLPISLGFSLVILGLIWFVILGRSKDYLYIVPGLVTMGAGIPLIFTPCFTTAMSSVAPAKRGVASGISNTMRQFAATLGMAIIGTLFINFEQRELADLFAANPATKQLSPHDFDGLLSHSPSALAMLSKLPEKTSHIIKAAFTTAFQTAIAGINLVSAAIAFVGLLFTIFFMTSKLEEPEHEK